MTEVTAPIGSFQNTVLKNVVNSSVHRLRLRPVSWHVGQHIRLTEPSNPSLLFIESGKLGLSVGLECGALIEVALLGRHSVVNGTALLGAVNVVHDIIARSAGNGYTCAIPNACEEFACAGVFHDLLLGSVQGQLAQTAQLVACNASHALEQRLSSWLLRLVDDSDLQLIEMTQEELATILGVRRTTVTMVMDDLREKQLIEYKRGRIRLLDPAGLERTACSCLKLLRMSGAEVCKCGAQGRQTAHAQRAFSDGSASGPPEFRSTAA